MKKFNLKSFREDKKLSQDDLCNILGITQGFISRVETGKDGFPDEHLQTLRSNFGDELIEKYLIEVPNGINIKQDVSGGNVIGTAASVTESTINLHTNGRNKIIEKQEERVERSYDVLVNELKRFHEISVKKDESIAKIVSESFHRNERNMERFDKLMEQQNKIMLKMQEQSDRFLDYLEKKQ